MVESDHGGDWDDYGNDGGDGWDDWDNDDQLMGFDEPVFEHQSSGLNNHLEIYSTKERRDIKFVNEDLIRITQQERAAQIVDDIGISDDLARALLIRNGWSPSIALRNFSEDESYIFKTFGFNIGTNELPRGDEDILCEVCYCEYPLGEFVYLEDCGHGLCSICYSGYLTSKVGDGKGCEQSVCPEQKCNMIVPERLFQ